MVYKPLRTQFINVFLRSLLVRGGGTGALSSTSASRGVTHMRELSLAVGAGGRRVSVVSSRANSRALRGVVALLLLCCCRAAIGGSFLCRIHDSGPAIEGGNETCFL